MDMTTVPRPGEQQPRDAAALKRRNLLTVAVLALVAGGFYLGHLLFRLWGQA